MSALTGLRVVDLSESMSGAYAARLLGDYGAEVIMVEPEQGHPLRSEAPFVNGSTGMESSLLHAYVNWNKHSVAATDDALITLLDTADVIVTTRAFDAADGLFERLDVLSRNAVHLSITPHGLTGPLSARQGSHLTHCARSGWANVNRLKDDGALQLPLRQTGYCAGVAGAVAALGACLRMLKTGHGDRVDVSELEVMASTSAPWAMVGIFVGSEHMQFGPTGPRFRGMPGPLWQAENGAINFGLGDWPQWREAMEYFGLHDIASDECYVPVLGRHQQDLKPVGKAVAEAVASRDKWAIFKQLAHFRCISGVVQNSLEVLESDQLAERQFFVDASVSGQTVRAPGAAVKMSATPWRLYRSAPALHGDKVTERARRVPKPSSESRQAPLAGVRVLTFTQAWAGTFATEILAFLGADVVQVEGRKRPDPWRGAGAPVPPTIRDPEKEQSPLNTNGMFNSVNMCKRAITLDMTDPEGREMFWQMVSGFDVVAENFSPHVMSSWGITLEALQEKRPDIIFASLSGYGRQGPLSEFPANGSTTEPMSGLSSLNGYEDGQVMNTGGLYPDPVCGYYFAMAIMTALLHRQATGEGQRIDESMMEGVAVQIGDAVLDYAVNGHIQGPTGNRHPTMAPHGYYGTNDETWVAIVAETDEAWQRLADSLGIDDDRFATLSGRKANEQELNQLIADWCVSRDADSIDQLLGASDITVAPVSRFLEVYRDPPSQLLHRGYLQRVPHPEAGEHFMPTMPWLVTHTPKPEVTGSPCFGEHSQEVFASELGLSEDEYLALEARGITGKTRI